MQISPVTMSRPSPRASAPPCLPLFIKEPLKEEEWLFALRLFALEGFLGLWLDSFALGFFGVGSFWKGKELLKGNY
jgi:hypothetical protein